MEIKEIMTFLEENGTQQNIKIYNRHGIKRTMFGVSYANLNKLKKKIKKNQTLAEMLWDSGVHDAMILALMIADSKSFSTSDIAKWSDALDNYVITDEFSKCIASRNDAEDLMVTWLDSNNQWLERAGWNILSYISAKDNEKGDDYFIQYLAIIEKEIAEAKNLVNHAMNMALIAIGLRNPGLRTLATETAVRIGKVEVDHGETSCKTPEAVAYINRAWERKLKKKG